MRVRLVLVFVALLLPSACNTKKTNSRVRTVQLEEMVQQITVGGTITPKRSATLMPSFPGYVTKLFVKTGDRVVAGAPIVTISQSLTSQGSDAFPLRAPFTGTVVQVLVKEGQFVDPKESARLVRIDDLSELYVEASASEIEVVKLALNFPALIRASAVRGRTYSGKISSIALAARDTGKPGESARSDFPLLIKITDQDDQLRPGMSVVSDVIIRRLPDVITIPHEFILTVGNQNFVVGESGNRIAIETGIQNDEKVEVRSGLKTGVVIQQLDFSNP